MPNNHQPAILPDTLPLGIKAAGLTLKSDARLVQTPTGPAYAGSWQDGNLLVAWEAPASQVDWGSVELPIQAGDWVECVDNGSRRDRLTVGARYQVERVRGDTPMARPQLDLYGVESPVFGWCLSRFKRDDGPHPEKTPLEQRVESILYGVDPGISEQGTVSRVTMRGGQIESIESVPVGTGNAQSSGMGEAPKRDPYTEHRLNVDERADTWLRTTAESARRSLRWEQAEKPRVTNAADQREFRKPHPWEEFCELESR